MDYVEKLLETIERAIREAELDWNPTRLDDPNGDPLVLGGLVIEDGETGELYILTVTS